MIPALKNLLSRLDDQGLADTGVIPWSCPIPSFGDIGSSLIATLGLNPSNREFVDLNGNELDGRYRRFHTLNSLQLDRWSDAKNEHLNLIEESCINYFMGNSYDIWFKELDSLLGGVCSYYYQDSPQAACHLDIIPYATASKWTDLSSLQRSKLLDFAGDTLGLLLRESPIKILVLNGQTVVRNVESISGVTFNQCEIPAWALPRKSSREVKGVAYTGTVQNIYGVKLGREITVLGFNHNIQSSFGVTKAVKENIRHWITNSIKESIS